ncbi:hypothetical protein G3I78_23445 [Streptomyces sp. SID13726]|nr:hypothetical protein [Streptomyces sp. SID13726]
MTEDRNVKICEAAGLPPIKWRSPSGVTEDRNFHALRHQQVAASGGRPPG